MRSILINIDIIVNGMIVQYYLSVYAINFFCLPSFSTFKIRVINQQNSQVTESQVLHTQKLDQHTFPFQIKLKGQQRILVKIKILNLQKGQTQAVVGQGVATIGKNTLDNCLRIPIYDKKAGIEEIAICSIDFLVSGHQLDKSMSIDKSHNKTKDQRNHSQDAVFSQMSYTVQSQKEVQQIEEEQNSSEITHNHHLQENSTMQRDKSSSLKKNPLNKYNFIEEEANRQDKNREPSAMSQQSSFQVVHPIQNTAYISSQSRVFSPPRRSRQPKLPLPLVTPQQSEKEHEKIREVDESVSPERIRQKLRQSEHLISKLKRYLSKHQREISLQDKKQKQKQTVFHPQNQRRVKHKRRNIPVREESMASYHSQNPYIKYHYSLTQKPLKMMMNFKVTKCFKGQNKANLIHSNQQVRINKMVLYYTTLQKCVTFDAQNYISFCSQNKVRQQPVEIKIPSGQQSFKISLSLQNYGQFNQLIGSQQGTKMTTILQPSEMGNRYTIDHQFRFCFDIRPSETAITKIQSFLPTHHSNHFFQKNQSSQSNNFHPRNQQVSFRQLEDVTESGNVKDRIASIGLQPWNYVDSYLSQQDKEKHKLSKKWQKTQQLIEKQKNDQKQNSSLESENNQHKESQSAPSNQKVKEKQVILPKIQNKKSVVNPKIQKMMTAPPQKHLLKKQKEPQKQRNHSVTAKKHYASQPSQKDQKSVSRFSSLRHSHVSVDQSRKKQIRQINNLRNGNRNNYKFKEKKSSIQSRGEELKIKEMWQKLLLKKKVEQDQLLQKEIPQKVNPKKSNYHQNNKLNRNNRYSTPELTSQNESNENMKNQTSKLYGCISGTNQVFQVSNGWRKERRQSTQYPLRKINLQVNNIAICQPQTAVDEDIDEPLGKFVKFSIKGGVTYFTQIIFNGQYNSILWKLSGCLFSQLSDQNRLQIQLYSTLDNKIDLIGKSSIRISKLFFLRNNHIYNGTISQQGITQCEYTLGFSIQEVRPFQIIREEDEQTLVTRSKNATFQQKSVSRYIRQRKRSTVDLKSGHIKGRSRKDSLLKKSMNSSNDLNQTLKKEVKVEENQREEVIKEQPTLDMKIEKT